ncbi:hypothetical protein WJX77_010614 [Trebouxia sp. C0004]
MKEPQPAQSATPTNTAKRKAGEQATENGNPTNADNGRPSPGKALAAEKGATKPDGGAQTNRAETKTKAGGKETTM